METAVDRFDPLGAVENYTCAPRESEPRRVLLPFS